MTVPMRVILGKNATEASEEDASNLASIFVYLKSLFEEKEATAEKSSAKLAHTHKLKSETL